MCVRAYAPCTIQAIVHALRGAQNENNKQLPMGFVLSTVRRPTDQPKRQWLFTVYLLLLDTMDRGSRESWFQMVRGGCGFIIVAVENERFRRNSACCSPVYSSRLSLRFGCGHDPICTLKMVSSQTTKYIMSSVLQLACIRRFVPTLLYFDIDRLPSSRLLSRLHMLGALATFFLLRAMTALYFCTSDMCPVNTSLFSPAVNLQ